MPAGSGGEQIMKSLAEDRCVGELERTGEETKNEQLRRKENRERSKTEGGKPEELFYQ